LTDDNENKPRIKRSDLTITGRVYESLNASRDKKSKKTEDNG